MPATFSGARLREARRRRGVTAEQLALAVDRSVYSVHLYERGRVRPPVDVAAALADRLGVRLDDLIETSPAVAR